MTLLERAPPPGYLRVLPLVTQPSITEVFDNRDMFTHAFVKMKTFTCPEGEQAYE